MENGTEAPEKLRPVMLFAGESGLRSPEKAVCVRRRRAALCLHPERTEVSAAEGKKTGPEGTGPGEASDEMEADALTARRTAACLPLVFDLFGEAEEVPHREDCAVV